jgi:hypothetical protein
MNSAPQRGCGNGTGKNECEKHCPAKGFCRLHYMKSNYKKHNF